MARRAAKSGGVDAGWRVVLLKGNDAFVQTRHVEALRAALEAAHGTVDVVRFDGSSAAVAEVLDECRTTGLMVRHKLVVVTSADQLVKDSARPMVERYVSEPSASATLVLRAETWHKGNLDGMIERVGAIVKCDTPGEDEAARELVRMAREEHGVELDARAATALVQRAGGDMGRLSGEVAKLALASTGGRISPALVDEMVGTTREEKVWGIQSALLSGSPEAALRFVREALEVSRHPPALVSWACMDLARKLHGAAAGLAAGARDWDLARDLKLWGDGRDAILAAAKRLGPARARQLLSDAIEADLRPKRGLGDASRSLELLALRISGA